MCGLGIGGASAQRSATVWRSQVAHTVRTALKHRNTNSTHSTAPQQHGSSAPWHHSSSAGTADHSITTLQHHSTTAPQPPTSAYVLPLLACPCLMAASCLLPSVAAAMYSGTRRLLSATSVAAALSCCSLLKSSSLTNTEVASITGRSRPDSMWSISTSSTLRRAAISCGAAMAGQRQWPVSHWLGAAEGGTHSGSPVGVSCLHLCPSSCLALPACLPASAQQALPQLGLMCAQPLLLPVLHSRIMHADAAQHLPCRSVDSYGAAGIIVRQASCRYHSQAA
jgi:hypothetical protein